MRRRAMLVALALGLITAGLGARQGSDRLTADVMKGIELRSIGPALATGRVQDIEIDPKNPSVWYVATAFGGLWKTVNRGITFTPDTTAYLQRLGEAGLFPPLSDTAAVEERIRQSPELYAMFLNTLNITMGNWGIKANVIPARSEAVIDCRLLPGQSREDWMRQVVERIDDDRINVEYLLEDQGEMVGVEWDTELFRTIESVVATVRSSVVRTAASSPGPTGTSGLDAKKGRISASSSPSDRSASVRGAVTMT